MNSFTVIATNPKPTPPAVPAKKKYASNVSAKKRHWEFQKQTFFDPRTEQFFVKPVM